MELPRPPSEAEKVKTLTPVWESSAQSPSFRTRNHVCSVSGFPTCVLQTTRGTNYFRVLHTPEKPTHRPISVGEWRISALAANTAKNSNAYFGTFSQPNRKAGGGNDSYTRKVTHGTEVTSSTWNVQKELWAIAAASTAQLGFPSEWWHTQAKPRKISIIYWQLRPAPIGEIW